MKSILSHKYFLLIAVVIQCVLWITVKDDPFFGDAITSTSQAANYIYDHNLRTIFYPLDADPGHPTLYAYMLAVCWKLFGQTLAISHLYSCAWAMVLVFVFRKIAKHLLPIEQANLATVLALLFPTYLSQSAMVLNTVALMAFFLFAVYGVFVQKRWIILLAAVLMCITHLQSVFLLLSLACFDLYRNVYLSKAENFFTWFIRRFLVYTIPVIVFGAWIWLHKQHTGWALVSPQYADIDEFNSISEYVKALLLIDWRLIDYGILPFYLVLIVVMLNQQERRKELLQWFVLIIPCCLAMAFFLSNTIGHRYFMAFGMLVMIAAIQAIQYLKPMGKLILFAAFGISLLAGNFLYYPGKTIGDATLLYRNYFAIEQQIKTEYGNVELYSHAPLANTGKLRYLNQNELTIHRINETPFDSLPLILQSNVNAEFTQEQIDFLTTNWNGKSFENGPVYVTLFLNPKFYPNAGQAFREPSAFEKWFVQLKLSVKN